MPVLAVSSRKKPASMLVVLTGEVSYDTNLTTRQCHGRCTVSVGLRPMGNVIPKRWTRMPVMGCTSHI